MAPVFEFVKRAVSQSQLVEKPTHPDGLVLEAWSQGYMVGSLIIMAAITIANMRKGVILHKLILLELIMGTFHGTFIFAHDPVYGWYLSCTAIFLNMSWSLHNVIAWMKNKPFLSKRVSYLYIGTVILAQPYWVVEIYANFTYFNNINKVFTKTRPVEAVFRDPWWIFTTISLFWNIKVRYELGIIEIVRLAPRFGVLLGSMVLSICFIIVDILAVSNVLNSSNNPDGINPYWKLAFVFKCLTDTVILDDFKTALDRLTEAKLQRIDSLTGARRDSARSPRLGRLRPSRQSSAVQHIEDPREELPGDNAKELSFHDALRMSDHTKMPQKFLSREYETTKRSIIVTNNDEWSTSTKDDPHFPTRMPDALDEYTRALEAARLADEQKKLQRWWS